MQKTVIGKPRGIINQMEKDTGIFHSQLPPSKKIDFFVQHFWIVEWNLIEKGPQFPETLPHPNVHLVFEKGKTKISGIHTKKFVRNLEGVGSVFGVKFKCAGFYPFLKKPVSEISNHLIDFEEVFGIKSNQLELDIFSQTTNEAKIKIAEDFLLMQLPEKDDLIPFINKIIETINTDSNLTRVENVCERFNVNKRKLERLFSKYVGVSPKWIIKRYRLHEALEQLKTGNYSDFTALALNLGYFDQAHFIKDFKQMIGKSPLEYVSSLI